MRTPYARTLLHLSVAAAFTLGTIAGTTLTLTTIAASPAPSYSLVTVLPVIECDTDADCEAKNPGLGEHAAVPDVEQRMARGIRTFRF